MALAATLKAPVADVAPPEVTTRGKVIIGGRRLEELFADVLEGRIDYETNLFRILCQHELDADLAHLAGPMLVGLATGQSDMRDLESVRLAASTHVPFEMALLPFLRHAERFAHTVRRLRLGDARAAAPVSAGALLAQRLKRMLARVRPASRYLPVLDACEHLSAELVAAAYLLECGVTPEVAPFVKIAARLPAAGAVYLAELTERPNRYTGIDLRAEPTGPADLLAQTGLDLLDRSANFAAVMVRLALGDVITPQEAVPINAALVAGAEYGGNSASSLMMRMIADEHTTAADAMQAMIATFGCYHLGALKGSAAIIAAVANGLSIDDAVARHAITDNQGRVRVAGFGHRFQKRDPRSVLLLAMCKQRYPGKFIDAASALDEALGERRLGYINMDGIGAAMGLQGGMSPDIVSLLTLIARAPGIAKALRQATPLPPGAELKARAGLV